MQQITCTHGAPAAAATNASSTADASSAAAAAAARLSRARGLSVCFLCSFFFTLPPGKHDGARRLGRVVPREIRRNRLSGPFVSCPPRNSAAPGRDRVQSVVRRPLRRDATRSDAPRGAGSVSRGDGTASTAAHDVSASGRRFRRGRPGHSVSRLFPPFPSHAARDRSFSRRCVWKTTRVSATYLL